jgi:hypothetical protein
MNAEIETYARELRWILEQVVVSLSGLRNAELHWRPAIGSANSAYAIANHVVASTRVYTLGFGCAEPVSRDRPAEFAGSIGDARNLVAAIRGLADDVEARLASLDPVRLDRRLTPSPELWGTGTPREISGREAIVESIRHAALHLGELRLTRDLALARS